MKASFWRRSVAYILDIIIVGLLVTTICSALPENDSSQVELASIETKLINSEITPIEYIETYKDILYDSNKNNTISITINLLLTIGYFVVFQYTNKGQTLGKMLAKIRVVDKNSNKPPTILKGLLRTIIICNIISSFVGVTLINILSKTTYISIYLAIIEFENLMTTVCTILVALKGRGVHDLISNTIVIEER